MKQKFLVLGEMQENCYILYDEHLKKRLIIDPADEAEKIASFLEKEGIQPEAILLTHGHFDHIMGISGIKERYDIPVAASEKEVCLLKNGMRNLSHQYCKKDIAIVPDVLLKEGEEPGFFAKMQIIGTPGHTPGSICFYFPEDKALYAGDTLFRGSVGRTDRGEDHELMVKGIREKLFCLPGDTRVFPGHGFPTFIELEIKENPFCKLEA